jgi:hypothetical protein
MSFHAFAIATTLKNFVSMGDNPIIVNKKTSLAAGGGREVFLNKKITDFPMKLSVRPCESTIDSASVFVKSKNV